MGRLCLSGETVRLCAGELQRPVGALTARSYQRFVFTHMLSTMIGCVPTKPAITPRPFDVVSPAPATAFPDVSRWMDTTFGVRVTARDVSDVLAYLEEPVSGVDADSAELASYAPILYREFRKYPREAFACARIENVVFTSRLAVRGQRRAAVPARSGRALLLDPSPTSSRPEYLARVLHHEFFHSFDQADSTLDQSNDQWRALNPASFRYGPGGQIAYSVPGNYIGLRRPSDGFITLYATTGVAEDRAEVFSTLMVMPASVQERAAEDPVLGQKVDLIRRHIARKCPSFAGAV